MLLFVSVALAAGPQSRLIPQNEITFSLYVDSDVTNKKDCQAAFNWAMRGWKMAEPKNARFRYAKAGEKPDYVVYFDTQIDSDPGVMGWIQHEVKNQRSQGVIAIKSRMNSSNETTNLNCLIHVAMHELGHLLGLPDDYKTLGLKSVGMLMGFIDVERPVHMPSEKDIRRVIEANRN